MLRTLHFTADKDCCQIPWDCQFIAHIMIRLGLQQAMPVHTLTPSYTPESGEHSTVQRRHMHGDTDDNAASAPENVHVITG